MINAAYSETVNVDMNASETPKVAGTISGGSGALTMSRMTLFCQKQSAADHNEGDEQDDQPRAQLVEVLDQAELLLVAYRFDLAHAVSVRRRDSYCPSAFCSCFSTGVGAGVGVSAFSIAGGLDSSLLSPDDRPAELTNAVADRSSELGQALRAEDDQNDHQDDCDFKWSDLTWHA